MLNKKVFFVVSFGVYLWYFSLFKLFFFLFCIFDCFLCTATNALFYLFWLFFFFLYIAPTVCAYKMRACCTVAMLFNKRGIRALCSMIFWHKIKELLQFVYIKQSFCFLSGDLAKIPAETNLHNLMVSACLWRSPTSSSWYAQSLLSLLSLEVRGMQSFLSE